MPDTIEQKSWSQNGEDIAILNYFGETRGRFADIGVFSLRELSNVRALADRGWGGVLVEADPIAFSGILADLRDIYGPAGRSDITPICAAIMPEPGLTTFSIGGGVSTASAAHRKLWQEHVAYRDIVVAAVTPAELLRCYPGPFDLLSLDVEGLNLAILEQLPLHDMRVRCAVIEHEGQQERVQDLCAQFGLTEMIGSNAENLVLARRKP